MIVKAGLRTGRAFALVREASDRYGMRFICASVILQARMDKEGRRVGYVVSRKCGNAVRRNRIKRRLRVAVAEAFSFFPKITGDFILIGRKRAYDCAYTELLGDIKHALRQYDEKRQLL